MELQSLFKISIIVFFFALASTGVFAFEVKTREVLGGDLLYRATALNAEEGEAVFRAKGRAAELLKIECHSIPAETRVFEEKITRSEDYFEAEIVLGSALVDCEKARKIGANSNRVLNPTLENLHDRYQERYVSRFRGRAPAIVPQTASTPNEVRYELLMTQEQERSVAKNLDDRVNARMHEKKAFEKRAFGERASIFPNASEGEARRID
jgi:hypothetical protein